MASLKESLNKFQKQQEECQSALSGIAAKAKLHIPVGAQIKRALDFLREAKYDVRDDEELFNLLRKHPDGIAIADVMDAYPNVAEDLKVLETDRKIWVLRNLKREEIAYPSDPRVDDELKRLFMEIKLPQEMREIEDDLKRKGMKPGTDTAKRRAMAQAHGVVYATDSSETLRKKGEITKRTKLTNAHLPELFNFRNA